MEITHCGQWAILAVAAFAVGIAKTGLPGIGILVIPLMAMAFPAKPSVGLLLPILIFADIFAVGYYRRHGHMDNGDILLNCFLGRSLGSASDISSCQRLTAARLGP